MPRRRIQRHGWDAKGLRSTEASVLQAVVQAYADVRRDQEIVRIRENNVQVLSNQLEETKAKFEVGQITRTDVAQAQAQLAASRALLSSAQAQLPDQPRQLYRRGRPEPRPAGDPEPPIPGLPPTRGRGLRCSRSRKSRSCVRPSAPRRPPAPSIAEARAANHPTISLQASLGYSGTVAPFDHPQLRPGHHGWRDGDPAAVHRRVEQLQHPLRAGAEQFRPHLQIEVARRQVVQTGLPGLERRWRDRAPT